MFFLLLTIIYGSSGMREIALEIWVGVEALAISDLAKAFTPHLL
jgi:hypothetical protein